MAHAIEIRNRAVELLKEGYTQELVSKILNVGTTSIKRWKNQIAESGCIKFFYDTSNRVAPKLPAEEVKEYFESNNDALLKEAAEHFNCTPQAVFYACNRNGITLKKKEPYYKERDEQEREEFKATVEELAGKPIVYVDESGCDEYYHRDHGRALRGKRIYGEVSGRKYQRTNFISGLCEGEVIAPFQYDGTTDSDLVEGWVETCLLPAVPKNAVIVMDNAPFHRKDELFDIVEAGGCTLIFVPKYSPDLNKIETGLWANLKNFLRNYMKKFNSLNEALMDFFRFK